MQVPSSVDFTGLLPETRYEAWGKPWGNHRKNGGFTMINGDFLGFMAEM